MFAEERPGTSDRAWMIRPGTTSLMKVASNLTTPSASPLKEETKKSSTMSSSYDAGRSGRKLEMSGPGEADAGKVATSPDGARAGKRGVQAPRSAGGQDAKGAWPGDKKGGVVLDLIVDLPVQELWALFTSDSEKSTMWRRLNRHRKYEEVTTGEWSASKGEGRERESTYITGFKSSFIRGKHKTYETHRVVLEPEGGASFAMEVSARVPTLPIGDCMRTVVQYCMCDRDGGSSFLRASYETVYTKTPMLKGQIEKNTAEGVRDNAKDLRATLATIAEVREDPHAVGAGSGKPTAHRRRGSNVDRVVTHGSFRVLMQYPHAFLALLCAAYLAAERLGALEALWPAQGQDPYQAAEDDPVCPLGAKGAIPAVPVPIRDSMSAFCSAAVTFYLSGHAFMLLVLVCHWVITNAAILFLLLLRILRPVTASPIARKVSAPLRDGLKTVLQSLRIKRVDRKITEMSGGEEELSPGEVVPAAAEAAMAVSKIAEFNHLSPTEQAQAVKGLRDKKQAALVGAASQKERAGDQDVVVEEVFENQRYQPFRGWGSSWPGHMLPTDCGKWSDRVGLPKVGTQSQIFELVAPALPPSWVWLETEWKIDRSGQGQGLVDQDGYYYGVMAFSGLKDYPPASAEAAKKTMKKFVRRRRWIRTRIHTGKIRDVLSRQNSPGDSVKRKIEVLLGWKKPEVEDQSASIETTPEAKQERAEEEAMPEAGPATLEKSGSGDSVRIGQDVILSEVFEQEVRVGSHNEWVAPHAGGLKRWSNKDASLSSHKFADVAPNLEEGFKWVGHWMIDNSRDSLGCDDDGWSYSAEISDLVGEKGSKVQTLGDRIKRRRWIRHQRRLNEGEESATSPQLDLPMPADARASHNSIQLDALDLPESPNPTGHGEIAKPHRRSSSRSLVDVLDLSGTYEKEDGGGAAGAEDDLMVLPAPPKAARAPRKSSLGPLAEHLPELERRSSRSSLCGHSLPSSVVDSPPRSPSPELSFSNMAALPVEVDDVGLPSPLVTDRSVAVTVSDTQQSEEVNVTPTLSLDASPAAGEGEDESTEGEEVEGGRANEEFYFESKEFSPGTPSGSPGAEEEG